MLTVPLVIYMPLVNDAVLLAEANNNSELAAFVPLLKNFNILECIKNDYCSTTNLKYSNEEAQRVSSLMEFNVLSNKDKIIEAIVWKVDQLEKAHTPK